MAVVWCRGKREFMGGPGFRRYFFMAVWACFVLFIGFLGLIGLVWLGCSEL